MATDFTRTTQQTCVRLPVTSYPRRERRAAHVLSTGSAYVLFGRCPSCDQVAEFGFAGRQQWSETVARRIGQPTDVNLWTCAHCRSTVTETRICR